MSEKPSLALLLRPKPRKEEDSDDNQRFVDAASEVRQSMGDGSDESFAEALKSFVEIVRNG